MNASVPVPYVIDSTVTVVTIGIIIACVLLTVGVPVMLFGRREDNDKVRDEGLYTCIVGFALLIVCVAIRVLI